MTDHDRNMRTLVLCFVVLVMALLPLRFVEFGNLGQASSSQVLGDTVTTEEVILPNAELSN